jgi:hypothetical protein
LGATGRRPDSQRRAEAESCRVTLKRNKPLRAQPRGKGNRFEREVVDALRAMGWTSARRNWQSGGQGGGDIIGGPADVSIECKHAEACRIWDWLEQCEADARPTDIPLLVFRRNRSNTYACLPLDELLALLKLREEAL